MNIEKLARHLREFTLDEIEMIAECDCKTELEHLVNKSKIAFKQGLYKYQAEKPKQEFIICAKQTTNYQVITIDTAIEYFLENYVKNNCKYNSYRRYRGILKLHIFPFFKNKNLNDITFFFKCKTIFYNWSIFIPKCNTSLNHYFNIIYCIFICYCF